MLQYISLPVFLVSFAIGLFFIYVLGPEERTVFIYPTPDNYASVQYKDNADQCFQYKAYETRCPLNPLSIHTVPIQA